jgi:hypothetical protein
MQSRSLSSDAIPAINSSNRTGRGQVAQGIGPQGRFQQFRAMNLLRKKTRGMNLANEKVRSATYVNLSIEAINGKLLNQSTELLHVAANQQRHGHYKPRLSQVHETVLLKIFLHFRKEHIKISIAEILLYMKRGENSCYISLGYSILR